MIIVIDTNLVFSAILNTYSTIGDLILNSGDLFNFYSCHFLWYEIEQHHDKLLNLTNKTEKEIIEIKHLIYNEIHFINEEQIPKGNLLKAINLVKEIDFKDVIFVALNEYLNSRLWTGDKKLIRGLQSKGYKNIISTEEMIKLRMDMEKKEEA